MHYARHDNSHQLYLETQKILSLPVIVIPYYLFRAARYINFLFWTPSSYFLLEIWVFNDILILAISQLGIQVR